MHPWPEYGQSQSWIVKVRCRVNNGNCVNLNSSGYVRNTLGPIQSDLDFILSHHNRISQENQIFDEIGCFLAIFAGFVIYLKFHFTYVL